METSPYISLYRKWRPQNFSDVVGQEHVTRTISNSIRNGRTVHAYLLSGSRGTGKTTTAKILAKAMNCQEGPTDNPCDKCENCLTIGSGTSLDVIEMDAASNRGIGEIRDLKESIYLSPTRCTYKVLIIDEVHMLTTEASNALLKILEEPPANTIFILATTEPHKLLPTIISRCQRFDFRRIPLAAMLGRLEQIAAAESIEISHEALVMVARSAQGGMRDAIGLLDQLALFSEGGTIEPEQVTVLLGRIGFSVVAELAQSIIARDATAALGKLDELSADGQDLRQVARELAEHFRKLMVAPHFPGPASLEATEEEFIIYRRQAEEIGQDRALVAMEMFEAALDSMRWNANPRIPLELAIFKVIASGPAGGPAIVAAEPLPATAPKPIQPSPAPPAPAIAEQPAATEPVSSEPAPVPAAVAPPATSSEPAAPPASVPAAEPKVRAEAAKPDEPSLMDIAESITEGKTEDTTASPPSEAEPKTRAASARTESGTAPAGAVPADEKAAWEKALNSLHTLGRLGIATEALLKEFHYRGVIDGSVRLWIPVKYKTFHKATLEGESHREILEKALAIGFGRPLGFSIEVTDEAANKTPASAQRNELADDIGRVKKTFEATIISAPPEVQDMEEEH